MNCPNTVRLSLRRHYGQEQFPFVFVDPTTDKPMAGDIYELQNGKKLGDTANDMIVEDGYIYIVMNVSKRLVKLNGSGVELASYSLMTNWASHAKSSRRTASSM